MSGHRQKVSLLLTF